MNLPSVIWPLHPYKGLNYYDASDAVLFSERDQEIDACGEIINSSGTKLLLIHGRTGSGKSSFLRAGLYVNVLRNRVASYVLSKEGEPCLIRSTADPISAISDAIEKALEDKSSFPGSTAEARVLASQLLRSSFSRPPDDRASALRDALFELTKTLNGTLILIVDQAEEIFTLEPRETSEARAAHGQLASAYFSLLENLCFELFDIKLIVALRTEFYGQFADSFRISPNLKVATVSTGLEQFMLHGVHDQRRLTAAIQHPTSTVSPRGYECTLREHYKFKFEEGLAERIARDVLHHTGESSCLPVMQIVCAELYHNLPSSKDGDAIREIRKSDYLDRGGVEGAIDRFVDDAIQRALRDLRAEPSRSGWRPAVRDLAARTLRGAAFLVRPTELEGWRHILSSLVARQEGGALTTLLLKKDNLVKIAERVGITEDPGPGLDKLSEDSTRLLRRVEARDRKTGAIETFYSLGHDALAASLLRWRESRGLGIMERAEAAMNAQLLIGLSAIPAVLVLLVLFAILLIANRTGELRGIDATLRMADSTTDAGTELLSLAAMEHDTGWLSRILSRDAVATLESRLRSALMSAPILELQATAINVSRDATQVILLDASGAVLTRSLLNPNDEPHMWYVIPEYKPATDTVVSATFIGQERSPFVLVGDSVYHGVNRERTRVTDLVPGVNGENVLTRFLKTSMLLTVVDPMQSTQSYYRFAYDPALKRFSGANEAERVSTEHSSDITSIDSDAIAYLQSESLGGKRSLVVKLIDGEGERELGHWDSEGFDSANSGADTPMNPLTFFPDGETIGFQTNWNSVSVLEGVLGETAPKVLHFSFDRPSQRSKLASLPSGNLYQRAPLAAVRRQGEYCFAWLSNQIIEVWCGSTVQPVLHHLIDLQTSSSGTLDFVEIRFDTAGALLMMRAREGDHMLLRVWNVSEQRRAAIAKMHGTLLVTEVCQVTLPAKRSAWLSGRSRSGLDQLGVVGSGSPCATDTGEPKHD